MLETAGVLPGPAAEINDFLNRLERSIEKYMTPGGYPDNVPVPGVPTSEHKGAKGAYFLIKDFISGDYKNNVNYIPGGTGPSLPE